MGLTQGDAHHLSLGQGSPDSGSNSPGSAQHKPATGGEEMLCWIVPAAGPWGPACRQATQSLQLPNLQALWPLMQLTSSDPVPADALTMPHERALLKALGLPAADGQTPWAAWALQGLLPQGLLPQGLAPTALVAREPGTKAWAWFEPCHWSAGSHDIHMEPPQHLDLSDEESQNLMAAVAPYAAQDGIALEWVDARHWLACGEVLSGVASACADRINGESLQTWLPLACPSGLLRRLQNEMQMLLYTHPINDARSARGLPTVNAFWPWGLGRATAAQPAHAARVKWLDSLCARARLDDAHAWTQAWQQLDATDMASALAQVRAGRPLQLVLCGARASVSAQSRGTRSLSQRLAGFFNRVLPVTKQLEAL